MGDIIREGRKTYYICKCDCGNEKIVRSDALKKGHTTSCGCIAREKAKSRYDDLAGQRFGRLTVLNLDANRKTAALRWICKCDCGNVKSIIGAELKKGTTRSCGCLQKECMQNMYKEITTTDDNYLLTTICNRIKHSAKKRRIKFDLSKKAIAELIKQPCYYCGEEHSNNLERRLVNGKYHISYNGIDRIDSSKGYEPGNVVSCCKHCNVAKSVMSQQEFYDWIDRVYKHYRRCWL